MYFAKNNSLDKFELYLSFLSEIIYSDNVKYKAVFYNIFKEVQQLSKGDIDYSSVSSDTFDIVSILMFNHAGFFKEINLDDLSTEDYKEVFGFLQEDIKQLV